MKHLANNIHTVNKKTREDPEPGRFQPEELNISGKRRESSMLEAGGSAVEFICTLTFSFVLDSFDIQYHLTKNISIHNKLPEY